MHLKYSTIFLITKNSKKSNLASPCYLVIYTDTTIVLHQVGDIENLQQMYSVEIVLEPPMSSKKLTVRGLAEDRRDVLRALPGILK